MSESRIASRYAKSLYDKASESGALEAVASDIRNLNDVVKGSRDFVVFLQSPLISKEAKKATMDKIFHSFHQETKSLFHLMADKSREAYIGSVGTEFIHLYNRNHGITEAVVTSATELGKDSLSSIEQFVKAHTGAKSVNFQIHTDPKVIGGLMIMFEGRIYDSTILSQIKKIKKELQIA